MNRRRTFITAATTIGVAAILVTADWKTARGETTRAEGAVKIRITVEGRSITATLDDTGTARDFASLLPLTVTLKDHASTEKIADLPRRLSTEGAPEGIDPSVGDITYYAPWGNLAIFYEDFGYASGLVRLGTLDAGVDILARPEAMQATIERMEE